MESLEGRELMSYGGSLDLTFGSQGYLRFAAPASNTQFVEASSATQGDGKVVIVGHLLVTNTQTPDITYNLAAVRYNTDGTLDTSFGTGGYFEAPALSTAGYIDMSSSVEQPAEGIAIQPDGKILLAGDDSAVTGTSSISAKVARLNTDGTLDTSFGTGGIATLGTQKLNDSKVDFVDSLAILPSGQIVVGGASDKSTATDDDYYPAVARLDADGVVDTSFGTAGTAIAALPAGIDSFAALVPPDFPVAVAQADGKVIIEGIGVTDTGSSLFSTVLTRFNADGTPDSTYGTNGQLVINAESIIPSGRDFQGTKLAIQPDGKLVIGGEIGFSIVAVRLNTDGTFDQTFGIGGADIIPEDVVNDSYVGALAIQPDGKILLGGGDNVDITRLDTNGLPDTSFGEGGTAIVPIATHPFSANMAGLSILADGKIVVVEQDYSGGGLLRLLGQGAAGDYDNDGISDPATFDTTTATFSYLPSGGGTAQSVQIGDLGAPFTLPAPGAYDGGGITEVAVYRPGSGVFDVKPYGGGPDVLTAFGTPGLGESYPAPGDYDHSGKTEYALYVTALGAFVYRPANGGADVTVPFGAQGVGQSIPAPADYFGTGQTDFAVYLVAQGAYEIRNPVSGQDYIIPFGTPGAGQAIPVPGDYDGSGFAELAVYVPATGELIYRPHAGGADVHIAFGVAGIATTLPAPGDYDGSGKTEAAGYLPGSGTFSYQPSGGGPAVSVPMGTANETVAFSLGTDSVAESGIGNPVAPDVDAESVEIPLTPDVLEAIAGPTAKKKVQQG